MLKIKSICEENPCFIQLERPFGVLLVTKGQGGMYINNDWAELRAGRLFFLNDAGVLTLEGDLLIGHLVEFPEVMFLAFLAHFFTHKDRGLYQLDKAFTFGDLQLAELQFFLNMVGRLADELERKTPAFIFKYTLFVLLRYINRNVEALSVLTPYQERIFGRMMDLIAGYYKQTRKTKFYADELGLKDVELLSFTKKVFGKPFFDVLMEHLVAEADLLLIDRDMSIREIAFEMGFGSPSHFNKYYSRYKDCTPREFRKKFGK